MFLLTIIDYILIACSIVILLILTGIIIRIIKKNKFKQERKQKNNSIIIALGGKDNIISYKVAGSRLSLELNDYSLVKDDELKASGVSSIIKMSSKITLVIGKDVEEIVSSLD